MMMLKFMTTLYCCLQGQDPPRIAKGSGIDPTDAGCSVLRGQHHAKVFKAVLPLEAGGGVCLVGARFGF